MCNYVDTVMTAVNLSPPSEGEWTRPDIQPCKKEVNHLISFELEQDFSDIVNTVQQHTICNSAYCLRERSDGTRHCIFKFHSMTLIKIHIEYEKVHSKNGVTSLKRTIVHKRNDPRVNKHQ